MRPVFVRLQTTWRRLMASLLALLRSRLSNRPDSEHGQALVRMAILSVVLAFLLLRPVFETEPLGRSYPIVLWLVLVGFIVGACLIGAIVFKAANIWLVSQTDLSKLVLGGFIVLMVVAFPKGIVGTLESIWSRRRSGEDKKSALATSRVEVAE